MSFYTAIDMNDKRKFIPINSYVVNDKVVIPSNEEVVVEWCNRLNVFIVGDLYMSEGLASLIFDKEDLLVIKLSCQ